MRDDAVAAALHALDARAAETVEAQDGAATIDAVVPMESARRRRWRRVLPVAAAAAIVAVALAALPALLDSDHQASTTSAAGATTTAAAGAAASPTSTGAPEASGQAAGDDDRLAFQSASRAGGDFGSYATRAALADGLRQRLALDASAYSAPPAPLGEVATCAVDQATADPALGAAVSAGTATVAGLPYTVLVFVSPDGTHRALLVAADSCVPAGSPFVF
jgi:negative regulator of sigma E activity